jgi:glycosyltransferase involved in cell wall biosynthesis
MTNKLKLAYLVSHPIQYQAPLLRRLAQEPDIDLTVFFWSDHSVKGYTDEGFGGVHVKWDVPLLEGYRYEFLPAIYRSTELTFWPQINRGVYRALKKGKFDAIWLHGYWSANCIVTMVAAKLLGIPVLERAEGTLIDHSRSHLRLALKRFFFSFMRHFVRAVLPISTRNRDYWTHYLGPGFPSFLVPYAVNNAYFRQAATAASYSREEFRTQLNLDPGRPILLYASKLMERKRCIDLIHAFLGIKPGMNGKRPYLLIVGDGSERPECEATARGAGESNVRFLGFQNQSQLARFFDLCDVFVLPSVYEPFGLIVNEVMNAAKPIIVSDEVGCQPDLIADGVNGRVFPARNVEALRAAIESVLEDAGERQKMGRRSLERISQWSFEEDIRGMREALNWLLGLPPRSAETVHVPKSGDTPNLFAQSATSHNISPQIASRGCALSDPTRPKRRH